jgi:hypothetical protein
MSGSSVSFDPSKRVRRIGSTARNSKLLLYVISAGHPRGIRRDAPLVPGDNYALAATVLAVNSPGIISLHLSPQPAMDHTCLTLQPCLAGTVQVPPAL